MPIFGRNTSAEHSEYLLSDGILLALTGGAAHFVGCMQMGVRIWVVVGAWAGVGQSSRSTLFGSGFPGGRPVILGCVVMAVAGLGFWAWKTKSAALFRLVGIVHDVTVKITITDPHGFHMRRCKDVVQVARKHLAHQIYIRNPAGRSKSWANAKSILSLQALGVRGYTNGEAPPVVEVRVHGFRPGKPLREIRKVLESEPRKYLNVYELTELAKAVGGQVVAKPQAEPQMAFGSRVARRWRTMFPGKLFRHDREPPAL